MTVPFWGRKLPRALARAALPEPAIPPGAPHLNPETPRGLRGSDTCPGCHARADESMPLGERMRLSNVHPDGCPGGRYSVVWK